MSLTTVHGGTHKERADVCRQLVDDNGDITAAIVFKTNHSETHDNDWDPSWPVRALTTDALRGFCNHIVDRFRAFGRSYGVALIFDGEPRLLNDLNLRMALCNLYSLTFTNTLDIYIVGGADMPKLPESWVADSHVTLPDDYERIMTQEEEEEPRKWISSLCDDDVIC